MNIFELFVVYYCVKFAMDGNWLAAFFILTILAVAQLGKIVDRLDNIAKEIKKGRK